MFSYQKKSGNFAPWAVNAQRSYCSSDITAIICIRAHEGNPWVLDRLAILEQLYKPSPCYQIIDFGSAPQYADRISKECERLGFNYRHIPDYGVFSLSIARNEGASCASTDLLYFTDIDFIAHPDFFGKLASYATEHDFGIVRDIIINLPAYHLTQNYTDEFLILRAADRSRYLSQISSIGTEMPSGEVVQFIAPYSNNFLCTRDFFHIAGGYDSNFRGYGSEDFELMIRLAKHTRSVSLPSGLDLDCQSPLHDSFLQPRPYIGFRRLGEAISFRAEAAGLKVFHLWHPTPHDDPWRIFSDRKRNRLRSSVSKYIDCPLSLASVDHLSRPLSLLYVCIDPVHIAYALPFRALGYNITIIPDDSKKQIDRAKKLLSTNQVDAFMMFGSCIESHGQFRALYDYVKTSKTELVVIEPGALPYTVCYASDISCNDPDFLSYETNPPSLDEATLKIADIFSDNIRSGGWNISNNNDHQYIQQLKHQLADTVGIKILIPLQPYDEPNTRKPTKEGASYASFEATINDTARCYPDITFVVVPHQRSSDLFTIDASNVIICHCDASVHTLIDMCDYTICYNSEIGLLSLIYGKPTVTIGHAIYNVRDTGHHAKDLADAVSLVASGSCCIPSNKAIRTFIAWLVTCKYSFFFIEDEKDSDPSRTADDTLRRCTVTHLNWKGTSLPLGRVSALSRIHEYSYINGRLGLNIGTSASWFDRTILPNPESAEIKPRGYSRGKVKSFLLNYIKRPYRKIACHIKQRITKI